MIAQNQKSKLEVRSALGQQRLVLRDETKRKEQPHQTSETQYGKRFL